MLFNFAFDPIDKFLQRSANWRGGEKLHWNDLSFGWFWIDTGDQELFRYTREVQEYWNQAHGADRNELPYDADIIDYVWGDNVLWNLSHYINSVPPMLESAISNPSAWTTRLAELSEQDLDERFPDAHYIANDWWNSRTWNGWYVKYPPQIWLWTTGDKFHIHWDATGIVENERQIPVWEATFGEVIMPVTQFIDEVVDFTQRYNAAFDLRNAQYNRLHAPDSGEGSLESRLPAATDWLDYLVSRRDKCDDWECSSDSVVSARFLIMKSLIEASLFATGEAVRPDEFARRMGLDASLVEQEFATLLAEYGERDDSGLFIVKVAGGYQMVTRPELASEIGKFVAAGTGRSFLSRAALETLAIIAYRQPVTQSEIEAVRGVSADGVVKTLSERGLVTVTGRKPIPGRPILYGTTPDFLHYFGLDSLAELPSLETPDEAVQASEAEARHLVQQAVGIE